MMKECCKILTDREIVEDDGNGKVKSRCKTCGAAHYRMQADPGQIASEGSELGGAPMMGVPDHVRVLIITYDRNAKQVNVQGHINERLEAFGMMELAKDIINEFHKKQQEPRIVRPNVAIPPGVVGSRRN